MEKCMKSVRISMKQVAETERPQSLKVNFLQRVDMLLSLRFYLKFWLLLIITKLSKKIVISG
nr:unnamed protein product [Callosobruchus analis]